MENGRILVIGARSGIGYEVCRFALSQNYPVTAFSRSAAKIEIEHPQLSIVEGNALDKNDLLSAMQGCNYIVQSLGVPFNMKLLTGPVSLFSESTEVLIRTMQESGIRRLVSITGFGAGDSRNAINPLQKLPFMAVFGKAYADKSIQEDMIIDSNLRWTIARPGVLTNTRMTKKYGVLVSPSEWRNGWISRKDVAHFVLNALSEEKYVGLKPVLVH